MSPGPPTAERLPGGFAGAFAEVAALAARGPVVVAVSGGLDSVALLHLLRFSDSADSLRLLVAHFDHGMRASSGDDARWVRGLATSWGLDARVGRAPSPPASEAEARASRYEFLETARSEMAASAVLTAHHADDQAETVLFRALRGTGQAGLAGIPERREPGIYRPLLGFWREEIEGYAERVGLVWREDPTNASEPYARNVLRTTVLPDLERRVAAGARRSLVRLARLAREEEAAWHSVLPGLLRPLAVSEAHARVSFDRRAFAALHPAVRVRVLRSLADRLGLRLDESVTRLAADFAASGYSGHQIDLGRSVALRIELDRCVLSEGAPIAAADRAVLIPGPAQGRAEARLGGVTIPVSWGPSVELTGKLNETFDPSSLHFPLSVRARAPGDRIRLPAGTRKVKKLLLERRIPDTLRPCVPLLVDADGEVLWIPGVARVPAGVGRGPHAFTIEVG